MEVIVFKRPYWKVWGEKWISVHTNHCYCSSRQCKEARHGKNHICGWTISIGNTKIYIDKKKPKKCTAPF